jgi:hypothetical protein
MGLQGWEQHRSRRARTTPKRSALVALQQVPSMMNRTCTERTEKRPEQNPMETRSNPNESLSNFARIKFTTLRTYSSKIIDRD